MTSVARLFGKAWRTKGQLGARTAIPSAQHEIVARRANGGWETLTILLPNDDMIVPNEYMPDDNEARTHLGRWRSARTPFQTFLDSRPPGKEKMPQAA